MKHILLKMNKFKILFQLPDLSDKKSVIEYAKNNIISPNNNKKK